MNYWTISEYRILDLRIRKTIELPNIGFRAQTVRLWNTDLNKTTSCPPLLIILDLTRPFCPSAEANKLYKLRNITGYTFSFLISTGKYYILEQVGIDIDLNVGDIRHRHPLFRYQRQICWTEKHHSDIGSVPILTSEFIPISDIEENKKFYPADSNPRPLGW